MVIFQKLPGHILANLHKSVRILQEILPKGLVLHNLSKTWGTCHIALMGYKDPMKSNFVVTSLQLCSIG